MKFLSTSIFIYLFLGSCVDLTISRSFYLAGNFYIYIFGVEVEVVVTVTVREKDGEREERREGGRYWQYPIYFILGNNL